MSTPVISTPSSLAMARSPQFVTGKNNALARRHADVYDVGACYLFRCLGRQWHGTTTAPKRRTAINEVINFEISDLVRSEFSHNFRIWNDIGYAQSP
jgi:hypothetical protein